MSDVTSQQATRPPLHRGNTVPLYVRSVSSSSAAPQDQQRPVAEGFGGPYSAHPDRSGAFGISRQVDNGYRRNQLSLAQGSLGASSSTRPTQLWQAGAMMLPTPPLSTSPGSADSYAEDSSYFSPMQPTSYPSSNVNTRIMKSNSYQPPSQPYASSSLTSPTVISGIHPASYQVLRSTRGHAPPQESAKMSIECATTQYSLSATIGPGFDSNCITIAARKGNILDIVADRWDCEKDCHHEWQVQFDRDADMNGIRAGYTNGVLTVTVKRQNYTSAPRPPQLRN